MPVVANVRNRVSLAQKPPFRFPYRNGRATFAKWQILAPRPRVWQSSAMPDTDALLRLAYDAAEAGNFEHARRCYEAGAALGDGMCLQALGYMYDVGEGVVANKALAMKLYRRAWKAGDHAAAINIAVIYRDKGNKRMMFRWYERVAHAGDGSAQLELARCYLRGTGVRKDVAAALRCLAAATTSDYITEYERDEAEAMLAALRPRSVE